MMEDIKKYQKAEKLKKQREETQAIPWYYDGLENLCDRIHPGSQLLKITDPTEIFFFYFNYFSFFQSVIY